MTARSEDSVMRSEGWDMDGEVARRELERRFAHYSDLMESHADGHRDRDIPRIRRDADTGFYHTLFRGKVWGVFPTPEEAERRLQKIAGGAMGITRTKAQLARFGNKLYRHARGAADLVRERSHERQLHRVSGLPDEEKVRLPAGLLLTAGAIAGALLFYVIRGDHAEDVERARLAQRMYGKEGPQDWRDYQEVEVALARWKVKRGHV